MKFTFLGTGNAFGHDGRRRSHYLWEGSSIFLIDASYDSLVGLRSLNLTIKDIDAIFISHLHPDHYMGLPQFALEDFYVLKKNEKVLVYGPVGIEKTIQDATSLMFNSEVANHISALYEFIEVPVNQEIDIPHGKLETIYAQHSGGARMQRITLDDVIVGYSGDSSFVPKSFERILDADITLTEASSGSHQIPDHTTVIDLLDYPIPVEKVVYLTHLGNSSVAMADQIVQPLYLAYDGLSIDL